MAKLKLHLTVDYEIFGDGSGSVKPCMIDSSNAMMDLAEEFGASILFYAEVNEYWAFKTHPKYQSDAAIMEAQMKDMIKRGHDVQLHLHPQWIDAQYDDQAGWKLNYNYWRLPFVPNGLGTVEDQRSLLGLFTKGKKTLEHIIRSVDAEYSCNAFRAGAWCIQPEETILQAMQQVGFKKDSTLAPGAYMNNGLTYFDFRGHESTFQPFPIRDNLQKRDNKGQLIEYPIWTTNMGILQNTYFLFLSILKNLDNNAPNCYGQSAAKSIAIRSSKWKKLWQLVRPQYKMLDFCGKKTAGELIYITQRAISKVKKTPGDDSYPLISIGHPKNFSNPKEIRKWLTWISTQEFISLA